MTEYLTRKKASGTMRRRLFLYGSEAAGTALLSYFSHFFR